jgi:nitroreductase
MHPPFQTLIEAAILAPSGDNLQPWRFTADDTARTITAAVDPTRDTTPMNRGQRMARIAVGCAVENMFRTAAHNAWKLAPEIDPTHDAVVVRWLDGDLTAAGSLPPVIRERATNRHPYDAQDLSPADAAELQGLAFAADVRVQWITQRAKLDELAPVIGRADGLMFSRREVRDAFLGSVRFDAPADAQVEEGLSLASLGISKFEQRSLPWLKQQPNWLIQLLGVPRSMNRHAQKLVQSAAGVCVILCEPSDPASDFAVGRAMETAWLELTARGYAVQPMMSLPVLDNLGVDIRPLTPPPLFTGPPRALLRFGHTPIKPAPLARRQP